MSIRFKKIILLIGDLAIFFISLAFVIYLRYPESFSEKFSLHFFPFSVILPFWLITLYIFNLYEQKILKNNADFFKTLFLSLLTSAFISISLFYLSPFFSIAPKTNLFLFLLSIFILETFWRQLFNLIAYHQYSNNLFLIGSSEASEKIFNFLEKNRQLGFSIKDWLKETQLKPHLKKIEEIILSKRIHTIVIAENSKKYLSEISSLYKRLNLNLDVINTNDFFEKIFQKVPLSEIKETWFLENIAGRRKTYDSSKKILETLFSLFLIIFLSPLFLIIYLLIKMLSSGPVIYSQTRIGRNEKEFTLYKFRTMKTDAEKNGAQWSSLNDPRLTKIGSLLRKTHLDELPQLFNVLKGEISFVGPRPERPEFVKSLKEIIPFYEIRHLVKPGVTGWAQINFRYGSSVEDAYEKLQYELYYIKHRSLIKDLGIIIKTIKTIFTSPK